MLEIVQRLETLTGPDTDLDVEIASLCQFELRSGKSPGQPVVSLTRVPAFTRFVDDALKLVAHVAPGESGGFGWENGTASARIGEGRYAKAVTPAAAICIAAILHKAYHG